MQYQQYIKCIIHYNYMLYVFKTFEKRQQ